MATFFLERPIDLDTDPWRLASHFLDEPCGFLLDSGMDPAKLGRYTFLGGSPTALLTATLSEDQDPEGRRLCHLRREQWRGPAGKSGEPVRVWQGDPFHALRQIQDDFACPEATAASVPLAGGLVGFLGYELGQTLEALPTEALNDQGLPAAAFLVADEILALDHGTGATTILITGRGIDAKAARQDAEERATAFTGRLQEPLAPAEPAEPSLPGRADSVFTRAEYLEAVAACRDHILAGDVFEVCLTGRMDAPLPCSPWELYRRLRRINPAPFASFLHFPGFAVVSASPERFLRLDRDRVAESRPIKGTRPRGANEVEDARLRAELAGSAKDRAENVMIVDLVRNDLGRVCEIGSVHVPELLVIEDYATVFQLVSTVRGRLRPGLDSFDLVRASFPGGSMTGAPKIAAMKIIDDLEKVQRGVYSGALGYFDRSGALDLSIVIRTVVCRDGRATLGVGGAVVSDSDPVEEYQETLDKARALLEALGVENPHPSPDFVE